MEHHTESVLRVYSGDVNSCSGSQPRSQGTGDLVTLYQITSIIITIFKTITRSNEVTHGLIIRLWIISDLFRICFPFLNSWHINMSLCYWGKWCLYSAAGHTLRFERTIHYLSTLDLAKSTWLPSVLWNPWKYHSEEKYLLAYSRRENVLY